VRYPGSPGGSLGREAAAAATRTNLASNLHVDLLVLVVVTGSTLIPTARWTRRVTPIRTSGGRRRDPRGPCFESSCGSPRYLGGCHGAMRRSARRREQKTVRRIRRSAGRRSCGQREPCFGSSYRSPRRQWDAKRTRSSRYFASRWFTESDRECRRRRGRRESWYEPSCSSSCVWRIGWKQRAMRAIPPERIFSPTQCPAPNSTEIFSRRRDRSSDQMVGPSDQVTESDP